MCSFSPACTRLGSSAVQQPCKQAARGDVAWVCDTLPDQGRLRYTGCKLSVCSFLPGVIPCMRHRDDASIARHQEVYLAKLSDLELPDNADACLPYALALLAW